MDRADTGDAYLVRQVATAVAERHAARLAAREGHRAAQIDAVVAAVAAAERRPDPPKRLGWL